MATLKVNKTDYPFKVTKQLRELVVKADVKLERVGTSKNETRRFAFLAAKASCEGTDTEFSYRFEEFIGLVEPAMEEKARKLAAELLGKKTGKKKKDEENN